MASTSAEPSSPSDIPRPSSTARNRLRWAAALLLVCGLAVLGGVYVLSEEGVVWQSLSAGPDAPQARRAVFRLRGSLLLEQLSDTIAHIQTGQAPALCTTKTPSAGPVQAFQKCTFDTTRAVQRHPHYTIAQLVLSDDRWVILLAPRDDTVPLSAEGLARFDLPDVAFETFELGNNSVAMEWRGALDDACGLRAPNATNACSPFMIQAHGTRKGTPHITSVALHFVDSKRTDRHHVPGMVLPAHGLLAKPEPDGPLLHITDAEIGWTDTVPKRDGSGLPKTTHPLEVLRAGDARSPLDRELARIVDEDDAFAKKLRLEQTRTLRIMATRMTRFGALMVASERVKAHKHTELFLIASPKAPPHQPPNRAADLFALPFAYGAPRQANAPRPQTGRTPPAANSNAAKGRPMLRVHLGFDGIDVHTRGVRLEPSEACASDGPSLCLTPQEGPTMAARFERVRQGDAEGDSIASTASLEAALALYPWRRLYNHAVAEAHAYGAEHGRIELTISADPDAPLALVVHAMDVLHYRLGLSDQAGTECPARLSKAEWAADPKPCMNATPAHVVLVSGVPVLTRGPAQAP